MTTADDDQIPPPVQFDLGADLARELADPCRGHIERDDEGMPTALAFHGRPHAPAAPRWRDEKDNNVKSKPKEEGDPDQGSLF